MLYYYSITVWETSDNHVRCHTYRGVISAKDFSGAAYWIVKEYTRTQTCDENDIEKLTLTPLNDLFPVGDVVEIDKLNDYLRKNND